MQNERLEFFKLDRIDQKVLFWIMENFPRATYSWIEYTARDYRKNKSIEIDECRLAEEVEQSLQG